MSVRDDLYRELKLARPGLAVADLLADYDAELIPAWEAVYEPGNVSDYLIGYCNDEAPAKAAAEAWYRSQYRGEIGRLEWGAQPASDQHDAWFDLTHVDPDGAETGPGITVRRRKES